MSKRAQPGQWDVCRIDILLEVNKIPKESWKEAYERCKRANLLPPGVGLDAFKQKVGTWGVSKGRNIKWNEARWQALKEIIEENPLLSTREVQNIINERLRWGISYDVIASQLKQLQRPIIKEIFEMRQAVIKEEAERLSDYFPEHTHWLKIETETATVGGCLHLPYYSVRTAEELIKRSIAHNSKTLIIEGDVFEYTYFYRQRQDTTGAETEKEYASPAAKNWFTWMLEWFDNIYLILGNHDERLLKTLKNTRYYADLLVEYLPDPRDMGTRVFVGRTPTMNEIDHKDYNFCEVISQGHKWLICHPLSRSIIRGRNAGNLATKYDCNVISSHGHAYGASRSDNGKYIGVDLGVLTEIKQISWVTVMKWPWWDESFVIVRGGDVIDTHQHNCVWDYPLGGKAGPGKETFASRGVRDKPK